MHEVALVKNLISVLEKEAAGVKAAKIKTIYLEVGQILYHDHPAEVIENCFKHLPKDKKLMEAKIVITVLPVKIKCFDCERESIVEDQLFCCKNCSSKNVNVISEN